MNVWNLLEWAAARHGSRTAVVGDGPELDYAALDERVRALAQELREAGVAFGDRLAVLDRNSLAYLELTFAAAGLGAVLTPLNLRLAPREQAEVLRRSGARTLVARRESAPELERVLRDPEGLGALACLVWLDGEPTGVEPCGPQPFAVPAALEQVVRATPDPALAAAFQPNLAAEDAPAHLYFTSGTTGHPKGVVLTHGNVCRHARHAVHEFALDERDVWGHVAPMFHLADAWAVLAVTAAGGTHAIVPRFEPVAALDAIARHAVTLTNLVPTMIADLLHAPELETRDLSSLRLLLSGGAPIAPAVVARILDAFGTEYVQTYGLTETSPYLTVSTLTDAMRELPAAEQLARRARTGRPFAGVELAVVRDDGRPVARDDCEVGEVRVRGETVSPGYWEDAEATVASRADGWFRTGDLATIDTEGWIRIVDRAKDMILSGGECVYSTEVENALLEHPAVREAAAYGVPDERWGEAVTAAVVLAPGFEGTAIPTANGSGESEAALIDHCRERLAGYKCPRRVHFLPALPRTGSGKVSKRLLRGARTGDGPVSDAPDPHRST